jgi:glutaredoxin
MKKPLAILILLAAPAGLWLFVSLKAAGDVGPVGSEVKHYNRLAGEWLLARSFPLPPCTDREKAAGSIGSFVSGEVAGGVGEMYSWVDEQGEPHYVDDPQMVPEKFRSRSQVTSLPKLEVYRGEYSKLKRSLAGVQRRAPPKAVSTGGRIKAIVYTADWCTACRSTKDLLRKLGVVVEERDVDKDSRAAGELATIAGNDASIPVTMIGKKVVGGFDEEALRRAIGEEQAEQ